MDDKFEVKDSGKRAQFGGGMVRDTTEGKIDYTLVLDGPMFNRWATHLTKAAQTKYPKRNWLKAQGEEELARFKESAFRHFIQWYYGEGDEDHGSALLFNVNGAEYVKERIEKENNTQRFENLFKNESDRNDNIMSPEVKKQFTEDLKNIKLPNSWDVMFGDAPDVVPTKSFQDIQQDLFGQLFQRPPSAYSFTRSKSFNSKPCELTDFKIENKCRVGCPCDMGGDCE